MTIIVTGGAGFIGGNYILYHLKAHPEDRVICLDKLTYAGNLSTLSSVITHPNFRFVKLDICDREGVYGLFEEEKPDAVINFAAESHVDRSIENPSVFLQTNIIGTSVLMDACRKYGIRRFHQVGTDEVYGDLPLDPWLKPFCWAYQIWRYCYLGIKKNRAKDLRQGINQSKSRADILRQLNIY